MECIGRGAEARSPFVASVAAVAVCCILDSIALPDAIRWHLDMQQDAVMHVCARERAANFMLSNDI